MLYIIVYNSSQTEGLWRGSAGGCEWSALQWTSFLQAHAERQGVCQL